ncbi:MAG: cisplatin damage response ATP-dependent DNA ligase [Sulfitobacter sp.]
MKEFAKLYDAVAYSIDDDSKITALVDYFGIATKTDALWAIGLFSGRRPKRVVEMDCLLEWATGIAGISPWLAQESQKITGDMAETLTLILPEPLAISDDTLSHWINVLHEISHVDKSLQKERVTQAWDQLGRDERYIFNKLLTGGFRTKISQNLLSRAIARSADRNASDIAVRLARKWRPETSTWHGLFEEDDSVAAAAHPYPFQHASPTDPDLDPLGDARDWQAEAKQNGLRTQLILRQGNLYLWSRNHDLVTDKFPDLAGLSAVIPDGTVLDGEILAWQNGRPLPDNILQNRVGRKTVSKALLQKVPAILNVFDLIEWQGADIRHLPLSDRRRLLEKLCSQLPPTSPIRLSPKLKFTSWSDLATYHKTARDNLADGVLLKHLHSPYGEDANAWRCWALEPLTIKAVLIYAETGKSSRGKLCSNFTFAVWKGNTLIPFAKTSVGLSENDITELSNWVQKNTTDRFGPVRQVQPRHCFEISFDSVHPSPRHKSGVTIDQPQVLQWLRDATPSQIGTLNDLTKLLVNSG